MTAEAKWNFRMLCVWVLVGLLVASGLAVRLSVMTAPVRLLLAATFIFTVFTGVVFLLRIFRTYPATLYTALFFVALFITWAILGTKPPDVDMLQDIYVRRLGAFEGVQYAKGGETHGGIDCSGLARVPMWQAMLNEGVREMNPRLLGTMFWRFWWRDMGALDILNGKHGYTSIVGHAEKLAGYNPYELQKGDLAIPDQGEHVLIYIGDGKWIEANPDDGKVVVNEATADSKRHYFNTPVTILRWWILEEEEE